MAQSNVPQTVGHVLSESFRGCEGFNILTLAFARKESSTTVYVRPTLRLTDTLPSNIFKHLFRSRRREVQWLQYFVITTLRIITDNL